MNELKIFENPEFGKVRTVPIDGEPWLVGKDVAVALGYQNPQRAIREHVDNEDKGVTEMVTPGGKQTLPIINESGVYSLIFSSKLPSAKRFKRWVTSEVLPAIRKTGSYMTPAAKEQLEALVKSQAALAQSLAEQSEALKALTCKVAALELSRTAVVYPKDPPRVSLTGLAKLIANTRRVMLDMGGNAEEIWDVTRDILNTCGFSLPKRILPAITLNLEDFL